MAEQVTAMRARDAGRLVSRYAPEIVSFGLAPPLRRTGPELHDVNGLRSWFAGFDGPIDHEIRDLTVTAGEDVAFCHGLNRLSATPHGAPERFDLWWVSRRSTPSTTRRGCAPSVKGLAGLFAPTPT